MTDETTKYIAGSAVTGLCLAVALFVVDRMYGAGDEPAAAAQPAEASAAGGGEFDHPTHIVSQLGGWSMTHSGPVSPPLEGFKTAAKAPAIKPSYVRCVGAHKSCKEVTRHFRDAAERHRAHMQCVASYGTCGGGEDQGAAPPQRERPTSAAPAGEATEANPCSSQWGKCVDDAAVAGDQALLSRCDRSRVACTNSGVWLLQPEQRWGTHRISWCAYQTGACVHEHPTDAARCGVEQDLCNKTGMFGWSGGAGP